jgi:hypothetical protein
MIFVILADAILVLHLAFVLFVIGGGLLSFKWPRAVWIHVPAMMWGALVEFMGWICPLTPLEQWLLVKGGETGYQGDFLSHYLFRILYPAGLTWDTQFTLGILVLIANTAIYVWLAHRSRTVDRVFILK